jgi:hypothetical protein
MFDPMLEARVVEQRKQDMLRQARLEHTRRELLGCPRALHQRWLAMVADLMVRSGTQLKRRYEDPQPAAAARPDSALMDRGWTS